MAFIVQVSDHDQSLRRNHALWTGFDKRLSNTHIEYVFVDSPEEAKTLKARIAKHLPAGQEPEMYVIPAGPISAQEAWTKMLSSHLIQ
jgi:hypothetical protein